MTMTAWYDSNHQISFRFIFGNFVFPTYPPFSDLFTFNLNWFTSFLSTFAASKLRGSASFGSKNKKINP